MVETVRSRESLTALEDGADGSCEMFKLKGMLLSGLILSPSPRDDDADDDDEPSPPPPPACIGHPGGGDGEEDGEALGALRGILEARSCDSLYN